ncbi:TonB-dependent receptor [Hyphomonas sp. NPDC076900]|uniref:TonB-dependent receptor n=1 Tax=unclassified Hyphomonas TaxID=2630699 RepID=UPI003D05C2D9
MLLKLFSAASVGALLMTSAANAETEDAPETETQRTLEAIIVSGEKIDRSLQETTTSVSVTTAARIEAENILSLSDIINRTANLSETYGSSGFTIRGINNANVSGGGASGLATVFVDGAPIPEGVIFNSPADMWDIAQVEVLRGPQSTLQGRNSLAGAIVMRSQDPTDDWSFKARAQTTDADDTTFAAAGGGPIIPGELGFRIAYEDRQSDGFVYNPTRQEDDNPLDAQTLRTKLMWTPGALPGLTARLGWTHSDRKSGYMYSYNRTDVPDYYNNRVDLSDYPNSSDITSDIVNLELDYDISDRLTLSGVTSWSKFDKLASYDGDYGPDPISWGNHDQKTDSLTQEIRLAYQGDRLKGLIGGYYSDRDEASLLSSLTNVNTPVGTIAALLQMNGLDAATASALASLYYTQLPVIPVDYHSDANTEIQTTAFFTDFSYDLTGKLTFVGGLRYDRETNQLDLVQDAVFVGTYPNPDDFGSVGSPLWTAIYGINLGVADLVGQAAGSAPPTERTFEAWLPKAGLTYHWTDDLSTSFVIQRGYRSGGTMVNVARSTMVPYDSEYTWNYEGSVRSVWLDGALTVNANAYYVDWTDQQVLVQLGLNDYDYQTINAGKSHLYGGELEASYRPGGQFDMYASLGYTKTEFDEFEVSVGETFGDLSGSEFAYAPHWTFAAGTNYHWDNGLTGNLNLNYRTGSYSSTGVDQEDSKVDGRLLVNGRFGYESDHWGVFLFGNNLFDEAYVQYNQDTTNRAILGAPRVLGISLETRW